MVEQEETKADEPVKSPNEIIEEKLAILDGMVGLEAGTGDEIRHGRETGEAGGETGD